MLTENDLIKLALEQEPEPTQEHTPVRKAIDTAVSAGTAVVGGAIGAAKSLASLDRPAPTKRII